MGEDRGAPEPRDRDREEASTAASSAQTASSSSDEASSDEASPRDHDHEAAVSRGSSGHSDSGSGDDGSGSSSDSIDSRGVGGDGGLEEAQQTERQLEEEEVKGKGASAAQQELLEAALSELWPCKRCKASKTKCEVSPWLVCLYLLHAPCPMRPANPPHTHAHTTNMSQHTPTNKPISTPKGRLPVPALLRARLPLRAERPAPGPRGRPARGRPRGPPLPRRDRGGGAHAAAVAAASGGGGGGGEDGVDAPADDDGWADGRE